MDESRERGSTDDVLPGTCCLWSPGRFRRQVRGRVYKCVINYKYIINSGYKSRQGRLSQAALWGSLQCCSSTRGPSRGLSPVLEH